MDDGFDFAAEIRSATKADAAAQILHSGDATSGDSPKKLTASSRTLLRFGYVTALVAVDGVSKSKIPGREMVECFAQDRELSNMLNDYLGELGEFYNIEQYLSPGLKLAGLTVGVYLQLMAAKGKLSNDSVSSSDPS